MGKRLDSGVRLSLWFCDLGQVSPGLRFSFFICENGSNGRPIESCEDYMS